MGKKFVAEKGFGFITPDDGSEDVFVHRSINGQDREAYLEEGQAVTYEVEWDDMKGKWKASSCDGFKSGGGGGGGGGGWGGGGGKGGGKGWGRWGRCWPLQHSLSLVPAVQIALALVRM